jgi:hypothetical protein
MGGEGLHEVLQNFDSKQGIEQTEKASKAPLIKCGLIDFELMTAE